MSSPVRDDPSTGADDLPPIQSEALAHFQHYIEHLPYPHDHTGIDGRGDVVKFVCLEVLRNYWTAEKTHEVLRRNQGTSVSAETVRNEYLQIFSILCYISCPGRISYFTKNGYTDASLPFSWMDGHRAALPVEAQFWRRFDENKWRFWPMTFNTIIHQKIIELDRILPICSIELLSESDDSTVQKVLIYPCCWKRKATSNEVVFKTLRPHAKDLWTNETSVYNELANAYSSISNPAIPKFAISPNPFDYITEYLGSFTQPLPSDTVVQLPSSSTGRDTSLEIDMGPRNNYTIVLEYAPGGSLAEFCKENMAMIMSREPEAELDLWRHMFKIALGVGAMHRINSTHQDLKELNILYTGKPVAEHGKPCFKISDLGKAHLMRDGGELQNNGGNLANMAPECCEIHDVQHGQTAPHYTKAADIWALGCIFSEMLIRGRLGESGLDRYEKARIQEISTEGPSLRGTGYERGFHNGVKELDCVADFHQHALKGCRPDSCLHFISDLILKEMLVSCRDREANVMTLATRWKNRLGAGESAMPPVAGSLGPPPNSPPPPSHPDYPGPSGPYGPAPPMSEFSVLVEGEALSVPRIYSYLTKSRKIVSKDYLGLQRQLRGLGPRRHRILIDDSSSMAEVHIPVVQTACVIAKLVKYHAAPGTGVEVSFPTADPRVKIFWKTKKVDTYMRAHEFVSPKWRLGQLLNETVTELSTTIIPSEYPIGLYILTDGIFGEPPPDLRQQIKRLLDFANAPPPVGSIFLSVTIILFGNNETGAQKLYQLKSEIGAMVRLPSENPIHICRWNGSVADMLLGRLQAGSVEQSSVAVTLSGNIAAGNLTVPEG
ncbi:kinase-like domain-containing protein [Lasiosphaeria ovina]|uniref:Kinase-like domain-containing protein n=1 Tax=Lasiosphaeria ovina TaxID=92902 RepID=A0AAE0N2N9_9PEZI|nr:kinase-like domain-containing protein [Lasiosphaeria ovina]